jgi:hypothetical protein
MVDFYPFLTDNCCLHCQGKDGKYLPDYMMSHPTRQRSLPGEPQISQVVTCHVSHQSRRSLEPQLHFKWQFSHKHIYTLCKTSLKICHIVSRHLNGTSCSTKFLIRWFWFR